MIEPRGIIFKNAHETNGETWYSYNFGVSTKDQKGDYHHASCPIAFHKGIRKPEHKEKITITDGWQKVYTIKGEEVLGWFVKAYTSKEDLVTEPQGYSSMSDDEMPF